MNPIRKVLLTTCCISLPILYFSGLHKNVKTVAAISSNPVVLTGTTLSTHRDQKRTVATPADIAQRTHTLHGVQRHKLKRASTTEAIAAFQSLTETSSADVDRQLIGNFTITAYALTKQSTGKIPGEPGFGITSSGTHASVGRTVAVDPLVIPIGSLVYIDLPGVGWRIAEDTGGAIRGRHIDLLLPSDSAAMRFGVKHKVSVYAMPR